MTDEQADKIKSLEWQIALCEERLRKNPKCKATDYSLWCYKKHLEHFKIIFKR